MKTETWRDVPSVPGYAASSYGRVMCKPFKAVTANGATRSYGGKPWNGTWDEKTNRFVLYFRGKNYKVAALVCEAFHGPRPDGMVCMHLDENSRNNRPENLAWGFQMENLNAAGFLKYCKTDKRARKGNVLSDEQIREIRRRGETEVRAALAREFGVSACHVSNICAGRARPNA